MSLPYQIQCDRCGRFMHIETGASWVFVPATEVPGEWGDERQRCRRCTEIHGPAQCDPKYRADICQGIYQ